MDILLSGFTELHCKYFHIKLEGILYFANINLFEDNYVRENNYTIKPSIKTKKKINETLNYVGFTSGVVQCRT